MTAPAGGKKRITVLDSIRGTLIIMMVLEHFGGPLESMIYGRLGFFAAAEGFFFVSGFVATSVACSKRSVAQWFRRRSLKVLKWHVISLLMFAAMAWLLPRFGWHTQDGLDGSQTWLKEIAAAALFLHLPSYLDVLPLYVVLLFAGGLIVPWVQRVAPQRPVALLLSISFLFWLLAQTEFWPAVRHSLLPGGTIEGNFDPFAWQFMFFAGAGLALHRRSAPHSRIELPAVLVIMLAAVAGFFFAWKNGLFGWADPGEHYFWTSKMHLAVVRIASFAAVALLVTKLAQRWPAALDWPPTRFIGQHSLAVYSFHVPLVYVWSHRPATGPYTVQLLAPIVLLMPLFLVAWLHQQIKRREAGQPA